MSIQSKQKLSKVFLVRVILIVGVLGFGVAVMLGLGMLKEPPQAIEVPELVLNVEVKAVMKEQVPIVITGYGQARALNTVNIAAEVPGIVSEVHPRLETGELIPAGEVLFKIDQRDYQSQMAQAEAKVLQSENMLARMQSQYEQDRGRLETVRRTRELAQTDFNRVKGLFDKDQVGTQSGVDRAEMGFNEVEDTYDRLNQAVTLYPNMVKETESALNAVRAQLEMATANFGRTVVVAPFNARVKMVKLEAGQYARPGETVLALADDSVLELSVPIDSRDARSWLDFEGEESDSQSWFGKVAPVECTVRWTEDKDGRVWKGTLNRVETFDQTSRTVTLAVRVAGGAQGNTNASLPLVDGMYCEVSIPGKVMGDVIRLPRWAVTYEGEVYLANADGRLEKRKVEVLRTQGEETFIAGGVEVGEQVIVTRLQSPLPNTRLNIVEATSSSLGSESELSDGDVASTGAEKSDGDVASTGAEKSDEDVASTVVVP